MRHRKRRIHRTHVSSIDHRQLVPSPSSKISRNVMNRSSVLLATPGLDSIDRRPRAGSSSVWISRRTSEESRAISRAAGIPLPETSPMAIAQRLTVDRAMARTWESVDSRNNRPQLTGQVRRSARTRSPEGCGFFSGMMASCTSRASCASRSMSACLTAIACSREFSIATLNRVLRWRP